MDETYFKTEITLTVLSAEYPPPENLAEIAHAIEERELRVKMVYGEPVELTPEQNAVELAKLNAVDDDLNRLMDNPDDDVDARDAVEEIHKTSAFLTEQERLQKNAYVRNDAYLNALKCDTPKHPGMYLRLMHGRTSPQEELSDWGANGPCFGPLKYVHITYNSTINICGTNDGDANGTGPMTGHDPMFFDSDLLYYDGMYYGDWELEQHH